MSPVTVTAEVGIEVVEPSVGLSDPCFVGSSNPAKTLSFPPAVTVELSMYALTLLAVAVLEPATLTVCTPSGPAASSFEIRLGSATELLWPT